MSSSFWVRMHGGSTHFPIALVLASLVFDLIGFFLPFESRRRGFHAAGFYTVVLGALGSFGAVLSGLVMSDWKLLGAGPMARHHSFVWPAFGLLIGLAVWRLVVGERPSRPAFRLYLGVMSAAAVLMASAGYWGGEMLLND